MAITAGMVKELREMTGAGMMDCKKALTETNGDMDAAVEVLRKSGAAKMEKKQSRIAAEGIARVAVNGNVAVVAEVNSETDFVAKNETFQEFVQTVADTALASGLNGGANGEDIDALLATNGLSELLVEKTATIGEKLSVRRFAKVTGDVVTSYIHGGGRIGVIIAANGATDDAAKEAITNIAMQVAAMSPKYTSRDEVDASFLEHEKEILLAQAKQENPNKPDNIIEKMIIGRLNKELKEICLLDQVYVQDSDLTVGKYVDKVAKENGANVTVTKFVRFETGEGLEKKNEDFAAEVAAQMNA